MGLTQGEHEISMDFAGKRRSCILYVPQRALSEQAVPLVLNFHGGGGNARGYMQYTCMNQHAEQHGYLVAYPNGSGEREDKFLSWNAGSCCGYAFEHQTDDVGFVDALLGKVDSCIGYDKARVYATGISNGAMMAYRLASELSAKVAAIAAVAGGAVIDRVESERPVPVMHIHSVDDPRALYSGGLGPNFPMTNTRVNHPNIENVINMWVAHNGCASSPVIEPAIIKQGYAGKFSRHTATRYRYPALPGDENPHEGGNAAQVVFWKLTGAGHVWPGGLQDYLESFLGDSTDIIDANSEIWEFFKKYKLG